MDVKQRPFRRDVTASAAVVAIEVLLLVGLPILVSGLVLWYRKRHPADAVARDFFPPGAGRSSGGGRVAPTSQKCGRCGVTVMPVRAQMGYTCPNCGSGLRV